MVGPLRGEGVTKPLREGVKRSRPPPLSLLGGAKFTVGGAVFTVGEAVFTVGWATQNCYGTMGPKYEKNPPGLTK